MNNKNNKIKSVICNNWLNNNCKFIKEKCSFAHGKDDIIKYKCLNGIKCWNENCRFNHPEQWNPYDNKEECLICKMGYCNKKNNKYNHSKNDKNDDDINNIKKEMFNFEKEFSEIIKNNHDKEIKEEIKDSNIKTKNINDNNIYNEIIEIKDKLKKNYIFLKKLNPNEWADYEEIDKTNNEITELKDRYNKIKNKDEKSDIFDNDLNLENIFMDDNNEIFDVKIPNINFTVNGISIDNKSNYSILEIIDKNQEKNNIDILIKSMETEIKKYNEQIKININNTIKDNHIKYILINNLNKISSCLNLFKNNYEDIKNFN